MWCDTFAGWPAATPRPRPRPLALLSVLAGVHHSAEFDVVQLPVSRLVKLCDGRLYLIVVLVVTEGPG